MRDYPQNDFDEAALTEALRHEMSRSLLAMGIQHHWTNDPSYSPEAENEGFGIGHGAIGQNGSISIFRSPMPSEGGRSCLNMPKISEDGSQLDIKLMLWIARWAHDLAQVAAREKALIATGYQALDAPAWSLIAHPLVPHLLRRIGTSIEKLLASAAWTKTARGFEATIEIQAMTLKLTRCREHLWIEGFEIRKSDRSDVGLICFNENPERPGEHVSLQVIVERPFPETAVAGMIGVDLAAAVSFDGLVVPSGVIVRGVQQKRTGTRDETQIDINVGVEHLAFARPPAEIATAR